MMLNHLGLQQKAELIMNAWLRTIEDGIHTGDIFRDGVCTAADRLDSRHMGIRRIVRRACGRSICHFSGRAALARTGKGASCSICGLTCFGALRIHVSSRMSGMLASAMLRPQASSIATAVASPPPIHKAATPRCKPRCFKACIRVTIIREPVEPMG